MSKREIKFRAWRKSGLYGDDDNGGPMAYTGTREAGKRSTGFVIYTEASEDPADYHWMQFTGLKDKNGRELYFDCDLCRIDGDESLWYATKDDFGIPCWIPANGGLVLHIEFSSYFLNGTRRKDAFEIIGNIYENPELIP